MTHRKFAPPLFPAILVLLTSSALIASAQATTLEQQRELFQQVHPAAELGDWSVFDSLSSSEKQSLKKYVLWPDLRATYLRAALKQTPAAEIQAFLQRYGELRPARELRYRYALQLARSGNLQTYQQLYEQFYKDRGIARLDCLDLQADLAAGRQERLADAAMDLWLIGRSQADECDPVFDHLKKEKQIGPDEHRQRYQLAIEAKEFSLARWLAKSIDQAHADESRAWQQAQANPADFLANHALHADTETALDQLVYAAERLTYRDPEAALDAWRKVSKSHEFTPDSTAQIARHIALWTARDNLPGAYDLLVAVPEEAQDNEVLRWRARSSLRQTNWARLIHDINDMPLELRTTDEWSYWRAVALQRTGQTAAAETTFRRLAGERGYYGFLAADELNEPYALEHADLAADEPLIEAIGARAAIVRARELFHVGLESRGRSEWDDAMQAMSAEEQRQAAILASRWGWHSRAIATAASLGEYDDLAIRYPLPYKPLFESSSTQASISPTWAYGIARSESLFMRDIRSSAGAIGLMQLMPATGRQVARALRLPFSGLATLTNPESNILLGTRYLGQMAERYGGNQVLATAAYNAGPHRVDRWLPDSGTLDARVWIETIPYNETRKYVKRVLAAQAIFHWRMTGELRRVSEELLHVKASQELLKLASR